MHHTLHPLYQDQAAEKPRTENEHDLPENVSGQVPVPPVRVGIRETWIQHHNDVPVSNISFF
jgi:hypothetical protein